MGAEFDKQNKTSFLSERLTGKDFDFLKVDFLVE